MADFWHSISERVFPQTLSLLIEAGFYSFARSTPAAAGATTRVATASPMLPIRSMQNRPRIAAAPPMLPIRPKQPRPIVIKSLRAAPRRLFPVIVPVSAIIFIVPSAVMDRPVSPMPVTVIRVPVVIVVMWIATVVASIYCSGRRVRGNGRVVRINCASC